MPKKDYSKIKEDARKRNADISRTGRDIAPLPTVTNPERKEKGRFDFRFFCESYFPILFYLPWSKDHLTVIQKLQDVILLGDLYALAMPRGDGKTTLIEIGCIWALLYGHHEYVFPIGSDEAHAEDMLDSIKIELETNDLLLEDFPEVCYPIRCLEGIPHRCKGQLFNGERTRISWTSKQIVLPTIPDSDASARIVRVGGLTGSIRGKKYKTSDGRVVRPSLVILDDPQTDESARSPSQCEYRKRVINGAVLGLAGPNKKIAAIMLCTVIVEGDLADQILDRTKHPEWQGQRMKMIYKFPKAEKLWEQYADILRDSLRQEKGISLATEFYKKNRAKMDEGAEVAWPERFNSDEISGLQHCMNLKIRDERSFFAERQNTPLTEDQGDEALMSIDEIVKKTNGLKRYSVPTTTNTVTCFVDVQKKALYYAVVAWDENFSGYVLDYGTYPDQKRKYFTLRDIKRTLAMQKKGAGLEGSIYAGLENLTNDLLGREYKRDDGAIVKIDKLLVDANWGQSTEVVYQFCRQSKHSNLLLPSHGKYVGASSVPFSEYKKKIGDRVGLNWRMPNVRGKRAIRYVIYDTNYWKSFIHSRLAVAMGDKGCLSLFGHDKEIHRMMAEQLTAEYKIKTEGRGRTVEEWKLYAHKPDNHFFDCIVGAAVAASIQGIALSGSELKTRTKRNKLKLSDLRRDKR